MSALAIGIAPLKPSDQSAGGFGVRMGLLYVKGFREKDWERIESVRLQAPIAILEEFARRSGLDEVRRIYNGS